MWEAFIIYLIVHLPDLAVYVKDATGVSMVLGFASLAICSFVYGIYSSDYRGGDWKDEYERVDVFDKNKNLKKVKHILVKKGVRRTALLLVKIPLTVVVLSALMNVTAALVPSKENMYVIAGGAAVYQVVTSDAAKSLGNKTLSLIESKLEEGINVEKIADKAVDKVIEKVENKTEVAK